MFSLVLVIHHPCTNRSVSMIQDIQDGIGPVKNNFFIEGLYYS